MVIGYTTAKGVNGVPEQQLNLMKAFLQGSVYCWCKNCKGQWFAARDLVGGDNYFWQNTPLMPLFEHFYQENADSDYAITEAGKAVGRLLLGVLIDDRRTFETRDGYTREYRWTGEEDL